MFTKEKINTRKIQLVVGITGLFLLLIAYLSYLGYIPLQNNNDEARRALVSAEMMLSGDYLTPTINGEIYLNKPPLYNWIIIGYFKTFGSWSMFIFRLQVIIAVLFAGALTFLFVKKYTTPTVAFFTAFAYLTNGRLLIYDSFLGLIDTTFSLTVYLSFMLIWHYGEKKKYYHLFLLTYLLAALGFLLKGIPSIVFQGLTLLTYFTWKKKFKILFHPSHFAGLLVFLFITGTYYIAYFSRNDIAPARLFSNLLNESSKRTVVQFGIVKTIIHFLNFPFEMLYHFAPWTLFIIAVFQKNLREAIRKNNFIFYCFLVFIINLLVYWTSPEVYARFLFMFLPLLYSILFYLFFESLATNSWQHKLIRVIILFCCGMLLCAFLILPFTGVIKDSNNIYLKCLSLALFFGVLLWLTIKFPSWQLYTFLLALICLRIGFNWFIMVPRAKQFTEVEKLSAKIADITREKSLYILEGANAGNFDGMSFQIATRRNEVLRISKATDKEAFFIVDNSQLKGKNYTSFLSFTNYLSDSLQLIKFEAEK